MGLGLEEEKEAVRRQDEGTGVGLDGEEKENEQRVRTVGEEEKVATGGDTACVSCPCL